MKIVTLLLAMASVSMGLIMLVFGEPWGDAIFDNMPDNELYEWMSLGVPFIPLILLGLGASLFLRMKNSAN